MYVSGDTFITESWRLMTYFAGVIGLAGEDAPPFSFPPASVFLGRFEGDAASVSFSSRVLFFCAMLLTLGAAALALALGGILT